MSQVTTFTTVILLGVVIWANAAVVAKDLTCPKGSKVVKEQSEEESWEDPDQKISVVRQSCVQLDKNNVAHVNGKFQVLNGDGILVQDGTLRDGKLNGQHRFYFANGKVGMTVEMLDDVPNGKIVRLWTNGKKRADGQFLKDEAVGKWSFWKEDGSLLNEGDYETGKAKLDKYLDLRNQKTKLASKNAPTKKSWVNKKSGSLEIYYNVKSKKSFTRWLGNSSFYNAGLKCKTLSQNWHLPSPEEWSEALEDGASEIFENFDLPFWTSADNITVTDPQQSMILGDRDAFAITRDGQMIPDNKLTGENGVRCTSGK